MARTYDQGCLLAYALDNLGERWTLLIVRDLLLGPRGFVDLQNSLGGVGGSILSTRLKELEALNIITAESATGRRNQYRLTALGEQLRPTIHALMRWSLHFMKENADIAAHKRLIEEIDKPDSIALGVEVFANKLSDPSVSYVAHLVISGSPYTVYYMHGKMVIRRGADAPAMARIETELSTALAGLSHLYTADDVCAQSKAEGDPIVLAHLFECMGRKSKAEETAA